MQGKDPLCEERQIQDGDQQRDRRQSPLADDLGRAADLSEVDADSRRRLVLAAQNEKRIVRESRIVQADVAKP